MEKTNKKTLILGASPKPDRYAFKATMRLVTYGHEVVPLGFREGKIGDQHIIIGKPTLENIHTITLYLNPKRQEEWYDYILNLNPQRIIFNPGTENPYLIQKAREAGIEVEIACTLVMLSTSQY